MRKKLLSAVTGAALVLSLTTACQASTPEITSDQAKAFQSRVLAITTSVSDGGYAAALEALSALETDLDSAAAAGSVSFARHQRIEAALTLVRTDLQTAINAQAEPEPEPEPAPEPEPEPAPVEPAPDEDDDVVVEDTETDAEKKAREEAEKAAEEAQKKADEKAKKAAEEAAKAAEEAKKKAEEEAKEDGNAPGSTKGKGNSDENDD